MADLKMPESQPCKFDCGWAGWCNKPTDSGLCTEHESATCVVCGDRAVRLCDYTGSSPLVCGTKLCANCKHEPYNPTTKQFPSEHLTGEAYAEAVRKAAGVGDA